MMEILNKTIVLVLNRNRPAVNLRTPKDGFCQIATSVATALEIDGGNHIRPVTWDDRITLPIPAVIATTRWILCAARSACRQ